LAFIIWITEVAYLQRPSFISAAMGGCGFRAFIGMLPALICRDTHFAPKKHYDSSSFQVLPWNEGKEVINRMR
jgi:hypothetical protein